MTGFCQENSPLDLPGGFKSRLIFLEPEADWLTGLIGAIAQGADNAGCAIPITYCKKTTE